MVEASHGVMSWVAKATVPEFGGVVDGVGFRAWSLEHRVEGSGAIAAKDHGPGRKSLHRKTKGIKLDGAKIVSSELTNRYEIFDDAPHDKYVAQM